MKEIHLLIASVEYEGSSVVRAYIHKEKADKAAEEATKYHETKPQCPEIIDDDPENDMEWDRYYRADKEWEKNHPADDLGEYYHIQTVEMVK